MDSGIAMFLAQPQHIQRRCSLVVRVMRSNRGVVCSYCNVRTKQDGSSCKTQSRSSSYVKIIGQSSWLELGEDYHARNGRGRSSPKSKTALHSKKRVYIRTITTWQWHLSCTLSLPSFFSSRCSHRHSVAEPGRKRNFVAVPQCWN